MATKRMFTKDVCRTDRFVDMPLSAQALYFHLCLDADVKGFVSPRIVMRIINATPDDLNVLIGKGFAIPFESGVIVITHWNIHNNVRDDREAPTQFQNEFNGLLTTTEGKYQLLESSRTTPAQIRLDKIRLDKDSIEREETTLTPRAFSSKKDITDMVLNDISEQYQVPVDFVRDCWDSACNWLDAKGKVQKNYKAFLCNWVKREKANYILKAKSTNFKRGGVYDARE